jgi:hypothetical protein
LLPCPLINQRRSFGKSLAGIGWGALIAAISQRVVSGLDQPNY